MGRESMVLLVLDIGTAVSTLPWTLLLLLLLGYLYLRRFWTPCSAMATSISDSVYGFCTAPVSVSSELAQNPTQEPAQIAEKLYPSEHSSPHEQRSSSQQPASPEELQRARDCGNWGPTEPSELFLHCYHAALCSLSPDPLAGMVSPSLMGSNGVLPLTIIAPVPDICRHMANLIVRAEKEVFLATNFWIASGSARIITDAIRELSRRAGARGQGKVLLKLMYDRGNVKQVFDNHQVVSPELFTAPAVKLPHPSEIPFVDMQVQNYHRPMLGTFHSKFMVVDRRVAVVQSNNIQDNDNLEMMTQVEGDIVDSIYDTALIAWARRMEPVLPMLGSPASSACPTTFDEPEFRALFEESGRLKMRRDSLVKEGAVDSREKGSPLSGREKNTSFDSNTGAEIDRMQATLSPSNGETQMEPVTRLLSTSSSTPVPILHPLTHPRPRNKPNLRWDRSTLPSSRNHAPNRPPHPPRPLPHGPHQPPPLGTPNTLPRQRAAKRRLASRHPQRNTHSLHPDTQPQRLAAAAGAARRRNPRRPSDMLRVPGVQRRRRAAALPGGHKRNGSQRVVCGVEPGGAEKPPSRVLCRKGPGGACAQQTQGAELS